MRCSQNPLSGSKSTIVQHAVSDHYLTSILPGRTCTLLHPTNATHSSRGNNRVWDLEPAALLWLPTPAALLLTRQEEPLEYGFPLPSPAAQIPTGWQWSKLVLYSQGHTWANCLASPAINQKGFFMPLDWNPFSPAKPDPLEQQGSISCICKAPGALSVPWETTRIQFFACFWSAHLPELSREHIKVLLFHKTYLSTY